MKDRSGASWVLLGIASLFLVHVAVERRQAIGAGESGGPASKATAKVGDLHVVDGPTTQGQSEGAWKTILSNTLKTPNQKDLFVNVSLECGLFTGTKVASKGGKSDTSSAEASVQVRVLVDGKEAPPGVVTFSRRRQELTATFQGLIDGAISVDPNTGQVVIDEALLQPEEVELLTESLNANAFGFVIADLGSGNHKIEVQARIDLGAAAQQGSAVARATIGKGSMTVEEVRMVKNEDIQF